MLDAVTRLPALGVQQFAEQENFQFSDISWHVGGGGANPALAAVYLGFDSVYLISKIGYESPLTPDTAGDHILKFLKTKGVIPLVCGDIGVSTGTTLMLYLGTDTRFLVADNRTETTFSLDQVTEDMIDAVSNSDIFYVSGYSLMGKEQLKTTLKLLQHAKSNNRITVMDVLPHKIYQHFSRDEFVFYTADVDIVISEFNTLRRLFIESVSEEDGAVYDEMAKHLSLYYKGIILRTPDQQKQMAYWKGQLIESTTIDYSGLDVKSRRGYFDKIGISTLLKNYAIFSTSDS